MDMSIVIITISSAHLAAYFETSSKSKADPPSQISVLLPRRLPDTIHTTYIFGLFLEAFFPRMHKPITGCAANDQLYKLSMSTSELWWLSGRKIIRTVQCCIVYDNQL